MKMKAIVYRAYGGPEVLTYTSLEKPKPKANELLIKIVSTSVTHGDIRMRAADPALARVHCGLLRPKKYPVLGFECAGIVEEVGDAVRDYKVGDQVMAFAGLSFGAYAEYMTLQVDGSFTKGSVVKKPKNLTFEEAGASPTGGITALNFLRDLGIETGKDKSLLIIGASGSVGSFALQLAKYYGAKVTGVTSSKNVDLVKALGADQVIDYTKSDYVSAGQQYDMVFDAVGLYKKSTLRKMTTPKGKYVSVKGTAKTTDNSLKILADLMEKGHVKAVIDQVFEWTEIVKAHTYVDQGHKVGNVVVSVAQPSSSR